MKTNDSRIILMLTLVLLPGCAQTHKVPGGMGTSMTLRCTVGATLRDPVSAARVGGAVLSQRVRTLVSGTTPLPGRLPLRAKGLQPGSGAGGEAFEALLDAQKLPPRTTGTVRFYVDGRRFFPAYLQALKGARQSIDVQTYIFDNDDVAVKVADVLRAKAQEVPVRVRFDGLGSAKEATVQAKTLPAGHQGPESMHDYLEAGAPRLQCRRTANAFFTTDHSKLHLIDGKTAFMGGMNLGREYWHEWHDLMARVEGPVVRDLQDLYERRWRSGAWWWKLQRRPRQDATPAAAGTDAQAPVPTQRLAPLRLLATDLQDGRHDILKATLLGIRCARERVWIQTPYFSCDEVVDELEAALKRGVRVRIIVPQEADQKIMQANNAADLKKLMDRGADVRAYPGMTHLKATVCDGWAMFGSANYDTLSQRINVEMNLASSDPRLVRELEAKVFEPDFRRSLKLTPAMVRGAGGAAAEFVGDQL